MRETGKILNLFPVTSGVCLTYFGVRGAHPETKINVSRNQREFDTVIRKSAEIFSNLTRLSCDFSNVVLPLRRADLD